MPELRVSAVMTRALASVGFDTPFKQVVGMLVAHDVQALPVIDLVGRPVGVICEVDALCKVNCRGRSDGLSRLAGPQGRARRRNEDAVVAGELMSAPAPTVLDSDPLDTATRILTTVGIGRVFVVDPSGRLNGVLTRRDVLRRLLRRDGEIQAEIEHALDTITPAGHQVEASVQDGDVRLQGWLRLRSTVEHVDRVVHRVGGVLAVHNAIRYEFDDMLISGL